MHYLGGKYRVAATLAPAVLARTQGRTRYVEPFLGGGSIAARLVRHFPDVHLSDAHPDLVLLWNAVLRGWEPPTGITKEQWEALRDAPPSPERAFAGFAYSYGGRWFHSYCGLRAPTQNGVVRGGMTRSELAARGLRAKAAAIGERTVIRRDYRECDHLVDANTVVYADPPYEGTFQDWSDESFDSAAFWDVMTRWHERGALVAVSGYDAPPQWRYAWRTKALPSPLGAGNRGEKLTEYLFVLSGGYARVAS